MLRNILSVLFLCLVMGLRAGAQERATPEMTIRTFITAIELGDVKQAMACVKGATANDAGQTALAHYLVREPRSLTLRHVKTSVDGTNATVTGEFTIVKSTEMKRRTFNASVNLLSSDGQWQIVLDATKKPLSTDPDAINLLASYVSDPALFKATNDNNLETTCVSNMRQLCLTVKMLVQDYDGKFKLSAATYNMDLTPYLKSDAILKCPADTVNDMSYSFNAKLVGVNVAKVHAPAQTVMLYEGKKGALDFRHNGKACVGFVDGHANLVNADEAKNLKWAP